MSSNKTEPLVREEKDATATENLKKLYKKIKDNLALFVIIPTVLGGLWQLGSLNNIGTPYVRYFSVSQLLSDGIIALISLVVFFFVPIILSVFAKMVSDVLRTRHLKYMPHFTSIVYFTLLIVLVYNIFLYVDGNAIISFPKGSQMEFIVLSFYLPILILFFVSGFSTLDSIKSYRDKKVDGVIVLTNKVKIFFLNTFLFTFIIPMFIIMMLSMPIILTAYSNKIITISDYYMPKDLKNISNIERIIKTNYDVDPKNIEITYFNDTYIFVKSYKIPMDSVNKLKSYRVPHEVIILKMDDLFKTK